jgi:transcriptional regulator with XRE-family HTH domain
MEEKLRTPGGRIRYARMLRKLTQPQLAKAASITQPSLSLIETGDTKEISGPVLVALCRALDIRPQWVISGQGAMELTNAADLEYSEKETEMIRLYRKLDPMWQSVLDALPDMDDARREEVARAVLQQMLRVGGVTPAAPVKRERKRK